MNTDYRISKKNIPFAQKLRKNQSDAEMILWYRLRNRRLDGVKFRRQKPIGPFIVDFICLENKIIIELDGGQHSDDVNRMEDTKRTHYLQKRGYTVLRFWNNEVFEHLDIVLEVIQNTLTPTPLPRGRGDM